MRWTPLYDMEQVLYRLSRQGGCNPYDTPERTQAQAQMRYRLTGADRPIVRIGTGWSEFGLAAGTALETKADYDGVLEVMSGRTPDGRHQLVEPKRAVSPKAKLAARPLADAVEAIAEAAHCSPEELLAHDEAAAERYAQMCRMVRRDGETHRVPVKDLKRIADAAGVALGVLYEGDELKSAYAHADERVRTGVRAFDGVPNMPGSTKVLLGVAEQGMAAAIEAEYHAAVGDALPTLQEWCAYGMKGRHGGGRSAERVATSGFIGTMTTHLSARPVDGQVGDPHLHVHLMLAHMVRCSDGEWRTVAAGGRDLMRHTAAFGELVKARFRERLTRRLGVRWAWSEHSGEWEIAGVTPEMIAVFSRRSAQIREEAGADATAEQKRATARRTAHAKQDVTPVDMRRAWHARAEEAGIDRAALVAQVTGRGPDSGGAGMGGGQGPQGPAPDPDRVAAAVWDPETGVTAHAKVVSRAKVLAAVAAACPGGVSGPAELEALCDEVLAAPRAVRLPRPGAAHMSNSDRYTSSDVLEAERTVTGAAKRRLRTGAARVPAEAVLAAVRAFQDQRGFTLSEEQRRTLSRLLVGGHGIDAVIGVAGAGKTTIMAAAKAAWEAAGFSVAGASTAAVAAGNLRVEAGIDSRTVASWVKRIREGAGGLDGVDVLVVDEAAMVDDRSLALLVAEADRTGTKIVGIGDPKQFPAVGIGGGFKRIYELVGGVALTENRRQREEADRRALQVWRAGGRRTTLAMWGERGLVHAPPDAPAAYDRVAAAWRADRREAGGVHEAIADVLVMAAYNRDVRQINARCRAAARADGLLGEEAAFALAGGERIHLAVGDQVRVTRNDYRSRRRESRGEPDVLNGFRGVVLDVDRRRGAHIEWRFGGRTRRAWIAPEAIARGDLVHGYALTIAGAQGLTCRRAHVYGVGADAHSLYPGMSRAKERSDLYLPAAELESEEMKRVLGPARTDQERLGRVLAAYGAALTDEDEGMVIDELKKAGQRPGEEQVGADRLPEWMLDPAARRALRAPGGRFEPVPGGGGRPTPPTRLEADPAHEVSR
ncbi:relaxase domain-containing protein [Nocardiopsis sp. CNT-189]|uniref:MobF family relaxase n=1 Tax=Nocardiopsis oceanisediminis TaxID=2816862 RepID=UPI003B302E52